MANNLDLDQISILSAMPKIKAAILRRTPTFLWAGPGIGKSSIIHQLAKELGGYAIDLRMHQMQPTDITGIPYHNKELNTMSWAPPVLLPNPNDEKVKNAPVIILFLDELNSAVPAVQASAYQLTLDRRAGEYILPDNVVIIAAGNRDTDGGVTHRMASPLRNRFSHLSIKADFDSWFDWAVMNNIHPDIIGYLNANKCDLYTFEQAQSSTVFATPRSWEFASRYLWPVEVKGPDGSVSSHSVADEDLPGLLAGTIGDGLSIKFRAFRKLSSKLPKPDDILSGKVTKLENKDISAQYSLIIAILYELNDELKTNSKPAPESRMQKVDWNSEKVQKEWVARLDNYVNFLMDNFDDELGIMGAGLSFGKYKFPMEMKLMKSFKAFSAKYGPYILDQKA